MNDTTGVGAYAADGSLRVTIVTGETYTGLFAADGSMNVVVVEATDTPAGRYHACGALRGVVYTDQTGMIAPNGALYMSNLSFYDRYAVLHRTFGDLTLVSASGLTNEGQMSGSLSIALVSSAGLTAAPSFEWRASGYAFGVPQKKYTSGAASTDDEELMLLY